MSALEGVQYKFYRRCLMFKELNWKFRNAILDRGLQIMIHHLYFRLKFLYLALIYYLPTFFFSFVQNVQVLQLVKLAWHYPPLHTITKLQGNVTGISLRFNIMATKAPKLEVYQINAHGDRLYFGKRWERLRDIGILENRTVLQQLLLFIDIVVIRVISYTGLCLHIMLTPPFRHFYYAVPDCCKTAKGVVDKIP